MQLENRVYGCIYYLVPWVLHMQSCSSLLVYCLHEFLYRQAQTFFLGNLFIILNADLSPAGLPLAHEMHNYLARDDDRLGSYSVKDTQTIGSAYDHYLQNGVSCLYKLRFCFQENMS